VKVWFTQRGSLDKTEQFLRNAQKLDIRKLVVPYAQKGVQALIAHTPKDSGVAASSWGYTIEGGKNKCRVIWTNSDVENGFPVVIALQYGYGTGTGGYVQGRDFINPAMKPIFDEISEAVWKAVIEG